MDEGRRNIQSYSPHDVGSEIWRKKNGATNKYKSTEIFTFRGYLIYIYIYI